MSEEITPYETLRTGTITYTDIVDFITGGFAKKKMLLNRHKEDPLEENFDKRLDGMCSEFEEMIEALEDFTESPTEENAIKLLDESGDIINEITFTAAKVAGFTSLIRK